MGKSRGNKEELSMEPTMTQVLTLEIVYEEVRELKIFCDSFDERLRHHEQYRESTERTRDKVFDDKKFTVRDMLWETARKLRDDGKEIVHSMTETIFGPIIVENSFIGDTEVWTVIWIFKNPTETVSMKALDLTNGQKLGEIKYQEKLLPALMEILT